MNTSAPTTLLRSDLVSGCATRYSIISRSPLYIYSTPKNDPLQTVSDYAAKLNAAPIDIVCCGIGSNGHLAFNDPLTVKIVELDTLCRKQQVDEQCFATLNDVPTHALTITIPGLAQLPQLGACTNYFE